MDTILNTNVNKVDLSKIPDLDNIIVLRKKESDEKQNKIKIHRKEKTAEYRKKNRKELAEKSRKYRANNLEKERARDRK